MKFKEFSKWCNERACDGCWGMAEAIVCCETAQAIYKLPFWKREKAWAEIYKDNIIPVVIATNNKIKEYLEDHKDEIIQNN